MWLRQDCCGYNHTQMCVYAVDVCVQCDASTRACMRLSDASYIAMHTVAIHVHGECAPRNAVSDIVHIMQPAATSV